MLIIWNRDIHSILVNYFLIVYNFWVIYLQEKRLEEEEAEAQLNMQLAEEAAHAKMARDLSNEVC